MKCLRFYKDDAKRQAYVKRQYDRYYGATSFAINNNRRWTEEEIALVMNHDITDKEIARKLGRSVHAVQLKRHYVGRKMA